MRFFFTLIFFGVLILIVYRRLIEPFLEGYRGVRKPYNRQPISKKKRKVDISSAQDAEFKELD
jgi:hypothetical protein